jgi:hypothetical protein
MAGYENDNHNAWVGLQVYPSSRLEVFANTLMNKGKATIAGFDYSAGSLAASMPGLDFPLHSQSMAGFSDLDISRFGQMVGFNYRLSNELVLNGMLDYSKYDDKQPFTFDASGKYLNFYAGVSWLF